MGCVDTLHPVIPFKRVPSAITVARPNVLLLFADDWGWGDLGANWKATVGLTPHMDALAASGM